MSTVFQYFMDVVNVVIQAFLGVMTGLGNIFSQITDIGKGIMGLGIALGSAIVGWAEKMAEGLKNALTSAFSFIETGFMKLAEGFGNFFNLAFQWVASGLTWIAQQIYNFGMWVYNGLVYIWNFVSGIFSAVWNAIYNFFAGISSAIGNWWGNIINTVNSWWTDLVKAIRNKITLTIMADVTLAVGWKSLERMSNMTGLKDMGYGFLGMVSAPIAGYIFGSIVDAMIPIPSTEPYKLIPDIGMFSFTPTPLTISPPSEKTYPSIGAPTKPAGYFAGIYIEETPIELSYDVDATRQSSRPANINLSGEAYMTGQQSNNLGISLTYETQIG
jgi:phage-related protein